VRAFEAAARHGSFKEAARELFVTPGAISQQVKALEEELGTPLFLRLTRQVKLTEAGRLLLPAAQEAFERLSGAIGQLRARETSGPLTVSVVPSFAVKWLVPRLGRFRARHPEIEVRISATRTLVDFARDEVDVGIRHGLGVYPGLRPVWLMSEDFFPVCSPKLPGWPESLRRPADLARHTLIHDETTRDWDLWVRAMDLRGVDTSKGPVFSDAILAIQAALEGQGVALTRGELVEREMESGLLARPFSVTMPAEYACYLVCPEAAFDQPKIRAFREWLIEETGAGGKPEKPAGKTLGVKAPLPRSAERTQNQLSHSVPAAAASTVTGKPTLR
jgi:LysR family glycine cleavage system transcriptional activator